MNKRKMNKTLLPVISLIMIGGMGINGNTAQPVLNVSKTVKTGEQAEEKYSCEKITKNSYHDCFLTFSTSEQYKKYMANTQSYEIQLNNNNNCSIVSDFTDANYYKAGQYSTLDMTKLDSTSVLTNKFLHVFELTGTTADKYLCLQFDSGHSWLSKAYTENSGFVKCCDLYYYKNGEKISLRNSDGLIGNSYYICEETNFESIYIKNPFYGKAYPENCFLSYSDFLGNHYQYDDDNNFVNTGYFYQSHSFSENTPEEFENNGYYSDYSSSLGQIYESNTCNLLFDSEGIGKSIVNNAPYSQCYVFFSGSGISCESGTYNPFDSEVFKSRGLEVTKNYIWNSVDKRQQIFTGFYGRIDQIQSLLTNPIAGTTNFGFSGTPTSANTNVANLVDSDMKERNITFFLYNSDQDYKNIVYSIPNVPKKEDVLAGLSGKDLFGVDCTLAINDLGSNHYEQRLGEQQLGIIGTDANGFKYRCILKISVIDSTAPVVSLRKNISFCAGIETLHLIDLPAYFDISDSGSEEFGGGLASDPVYTLDGKPLTADKAFGIEDIGIHKIGIAVSDQAGNTRNSAFSFSVYDGVKPVLSKIGGSALSSEVMMGKKCAESITKEGFLSFFNATDDVDKDLTSRVKVTGDFIDSEKTDQKIGIEVSDSAGNKAEASIPVSVKNELPNVAIISDRNVVCTDKTILQPGDFESIVENGIHSGEDVSFVSVDYKSYVVGKGKTGTYPVYYTCRIGNDLQETSGTFDVKVVDADSFAKKESNVFIAFFNSIGNFFNEIGSWFTNGWQCLCNWLSNKGWFTDEQVKENEDKTADEPDNSADISDSSLNS